VLDDEVVATLDEQFDEDLDRSDRVKPAEWEERSLPQRVMEGLTRPLHHEV